MVLSFLGGKISEQDNDDPRVTAARKFWDETGQVLDLVECQRLVGFHGSYDSQDEVSCESKRDMIQIWSGCAKYVVYVVRDDGDHPKWDDLPLRYDREGIHPTWSEEESDFYLVWTDWSLILDLCARSNRNQQLSFRVPNDESSLGYRTLEVPLHRNLRDQCSTKEFRNAMRDFIHDTNLQLAAFQRLQITDKS